MIEHIGTIALVIGFFLLVYGSLKYGTDILRGTVGEEAIVAAVACQGLTGATLAACQKAQPKPKPVGITPAKPKGITAAKPSRAITPARPRRPLTYGTGGGVGGPSSSAHECMLQGGIRRCEAATRGGVTPGKGGVLCRCLKPITPTVPSNLASDRCLKNVYLYINRQIKLATDRNAMQYGYTGLNPGEQLLENNAQSPGAGYQDRLIREKYMALRRDLVNGCLKKYAGVDVERKQQQSGSPFHLMVPGTQRSAV